MTENHEQIAHYPTLTDAQRQRAREQARTNLVRRLGGEPRYSDFVRQTHSRYGPWAERIGTIVAGVVLIAAFTISAIHVFSVGYTRYVDTGGDAQTAAIIGGALVLLSEAAVIALSLIPTLWDTPPSVTRMMQAGVVSAAFIAIVGNVDATIEYTYSPFDWFKAWWSSLATNPAHWMLATLPPFLTVLIGMGLKYRLLRSSKERKTASDEHRAALDKWRLLIDNIEDHEKWRLVWFNALWDEWVRLHGARYRDSIDDDTRLSLVLREMEAEDRIARALDQRKAEISSRKFQKLQKTGGEISGATETSVSKDEVLQFLKGNPGAEKLPGKQIAEITGASEATVSRARRMFSMNGHGEN